jgi:hypothetical protein
VSEQNVICGISGLKGYGKSSFLRELVRSENSLVIVDTLGEHSDWCPRCPGDSIREQVALLSEPPESFQWSFLLTPGKAEEHLDYLCKAAYRAGDLTFVLEETDYFSSANSDCAGVELLVRYGRHRGINLVWVTRNMSEISRRLTSQTDTFVLFRMTEPLYIDALSKRVSPEIALEVERLPQFEYIVFHKGAEGTPIRGRTVA